MRAAPLLAGFALGLVALLPARLALPAPPLAARSVSGSLWQAELADAQAGALALGALQLSLQPQALLKGRLQWQLAGGLAGSAWRSASAQGVDGLGGRIGLSAAMPGLALRSVDLAGLSLALGPAGACQAASGQVSISLAAPIAGQRQLSGSPACDGDALVLPLASADGRLRLDLAVRPGRWQARATVAGANLAEQAALAGAGFRADGGTLSLVQEGSW